MTGPIQKAIEALDRACELEGNSALMILKVGEALTALRSIRPATEEEMRQIVNAAHGYDVAFPEDMYPVIRACERRIIGTAPKQ